MKKTIQNRLLIFVLVLAILLPNLTGLARAETITYGQPNIYDIFDLTGQESNTVKGTDDTWDGQILGNVLPEHKENVVFKTKLTMGAQQVRLSLNAKDGSSIYDPAGYAVYINDNAGAPYVAIKRNQQDLVVGSVEVVAGTYELEIGILDILQGDVRTGKHLYVKMGDTVICQVDDTEGYLTGDALGTRFIDFHYGAAIRMDTTYESTKTYGTAQVYDIFDLTGQESNTVKGTDETWDGQLFVAVGEDHKENMAFKTKLTMGAQQVRLSLNAKDGASIYDAPGYAVYLYGDTNRVEIRRNNATLQYATVEGVAGTYIFEVGIVDILQNGNRVGKHLYVKMNDAVVCQYDDMSGYLTGDALGTKIVDFHYGAAIMMDTTKQIQPTEPEITEPETTEPEITEPSAVYIAAEATVYDLYDLMGTEYMTLEGRTTNPDNWGTTLGNVLPEHKDNMAFKTQVTMDEAQTVMLGIGVLDISQAVRLDSGYVLEIVTQTGEGEADTLKIHRADTQIYCADQILDLNGEYELEFGIVDLLDPAADNAVVGKRIYVKVGGEEILHYDDVENALFGDQLGTKVDVYVSGVDLPMTSKRNYRASSAKVYDLYDLTLRETLKVDHKDNSGNINWGVLIGNVEKNHKGNVALKTKVQMSRSQQQNLIIGLGLNGHWPVGSGHGYKFEFNANPDNKTDTLFIYKNTDSEGKDPLCIYNVEQDFDFNSSFLLEVGVVDLRDDNNQVVARRLYVKVDGKELMHFDDTKNVVSGSSMGTVVAAYASSGSVTLKTCAGKIPSTEVTVYDLSDLLGRAKVNLTRTDAGGTVIWSNELGRVTETNNDNYALRVNVDTSMVDRSSLQELILGLCKDTDLFDQSGYRLSLYFAKNGGTSLVLRDSATDVVLASLDSTLPQSYELEVGITDFYNSSKRIIGKKIFVKIDGQEVLSYLDKNTNRSRGNLLCAYTSTPVAISTLKDYVTLPVSCVINGETVENSPYVTFNTAVMVGQTSVVEIALGNNDQNTSVIMEQVLLNGKPITSISQQKGVYMFQVENPTENDRLTVQIRVRSLTTDEAQVYDLYELTGKDKIVIPANSVDQIGMLFADGQEEVMNRAIRFAYYIPATGGGLRLGYGSDTSDIWSRVGTHIEIWCGFATISHGFHVSALNTGNTDIFQPDSWSIVEVGIVKCYEEGVYKYDRWYVKAGKTLEDMKLITYYDSTQRHDSSLNIMARTPDIGGDFVLASTLDVRQVTDISEDGAKIQAKVAFQPLFLKGETVKIAVQPQAGKTLETLYVNGQPVETVLTAEGSYVYTLTDAQENVQFAYTLTDDHQVYNITADQADHLAWTLDDTTVIAGGMVIVQIKVDGGYTLQSLLVNGQNYLPMASYDKTTLTYTLTIRGIREDKHIQAQAEKLSQDGPVADPATQEKQPILPWILAVALVVLGGAALVVAKARKKERKQ